MNDTDQLRLHKKANFMVVNTPSEDTATRYSALQSLQLAACTHPLATHILAPSNTFSGVVFDLHIQ
ncbi:hypothetical protein HPB48_027074 [Haemaphysalis longicornis]|uniref:Uncharacterized protein n=1 Tax=Haemaphysalis longicornis TaxID=44386 RepID=A0A9J6HB99_HAELO|nr:hypothetical protein HPB48_027074 [Haemaphysalis longicornis]